MAVCSIVVADALRILFPVANHWQTIGTLMHIPPDILENIRTREREEPIKCLMAMLTKLVTLTDPTPTWKALAEAVEPINRAKAKEIRDSYVGRGVNLQASSMPEEDQHKDEYEGLHYEPEMRDLMNEVGVKLASKWRDIGRELKLEEWQLDNIGFTHRNDPGTNSAISEVFCVWQASTYPDFTWATILKAICSNTVQGKAIARTLKEELRKPDIC